jgi:gliding motility-associated-like protein
MKKITDLLILLFSFTAFAQFSKTHYIPPLSGSSNVIAEEQYLYISTPSLTPINFKIIQLGSNNVIGTVSRDTPYSFYLGNGINTRLHVGSGFVNSVISNKGFIVEADDVVYVTARVIAGGGNQAGLLVSKGLAALGTRFRIGAYTNLDAPQYGVNHYTFISVLATENNTTVSFDDIRPGVVLINNELVGNNPLPVILNSGESFVLAVQGPDEANRDGLIGSLVTSDKPIAVNCGSYGGTNGEMSNLDLGFDQIVSAERTGQEFIFIKSTGLDAVEKVLIVADEDNTQVFLNGNPTPSYTLNAGQYAAIAGNNYSSQGNMYVNTSKNVFAYQSVGDNSRSDQANQEMFFVPPLSCQTPKVIDNIPFLEQIGTRFFTGRVTIVTKTGSDLTFTINGINYTLTTLPAGIIIDGPTNVTGNLNYETYTITGLSGNVSVFSTSELYLASYGSDGAATFGGFYSGFTFKPEITFDQVDLTQSTCIPNVQLQVSTLSGFDTFQWYFNDVAMLGETGSVLNPTLPGYYFVSATISACGTTLISDKIPVSSCPTDSDNDGANDNFDGDSDNDGIANCTESYGNINFNLTNTNVGSIAIGNYSNSYIGATSFFGSGIPSSTPITGFSDGNFVTEATEGKDNSISYTLTFNQPISFAIEYGTIAGTTDLLTSDTEIIVKCPVNQTITILNPNDQIVIDTNYDGIYENGVTQFSSFEIRFRLNETTPLPIGTGTFKIIASLINSITVTNKNLSDVTTSRVALKLFASCVPIDSDGDGISDQFDFDSDNDGILDVVESQGQNFIALSNSDTNNDGIDNAFGSGLTPVDTDIDGIYDYLDLDSDNDGIHDLDESGSGAIDSNNNGVIDGSNFGTNGLANQLETTPNNGVLNFTLADTDNDGIYNAIELDSDNDLCNDVIEAGYLDSNNDGLLGGISPPTINGNGIVNSGTGYLNPNSNYMISAPIVINTQPQNSIACELQSATFTIDTNSIDSYQWQLSTNGGTNWTNIVNNTTYSGSTTIILTVSNVTPSMVGYKYRVLLNKTGNSCGLLSDNATLTTYALPIISSPVILVQCDEDTDGISSFNLRQKENTISADATNHIFTYYTTLAAANNADNLQLINNPIAFVTSNTTVYCRVENSDGCFRVAQMNLVVSVTQIPASFQIPSSYKCDDFLDAINDDRDGVSEFNFSNVTSSIQAILTNPSAYTIKYYKSEADFLSETDASGNSLAITNTANYRNIGYPNLQTIWVRVESNLDNSCYGFITFNLIVESLPFANSVNALNLIRHCDDNQDGIYGFDTSGIEALVLNGQTNVSVNYFKSNGIQLSSPLPNPFNVNGSEIISIRVTNNTTMVTTGPCYDQINLQFIVDDLPEAFAVSQNLTTACDNEFDPINQDGIYSFDTTGFEDTILGGQTGMVVYYFNENNIPLQSPLPNPFVTTSQNVTVIVENSINTDCTAQVILPFIINPTPKIDLEEALQICLPETQITISASFIDATPTSDYIFQWYFNGLILAGETNPSITVSNEGNYSVDVTNIYNCTKTKNITIVNSEIAQLVDIDIVDLSDINTVLVTVIGSGDYQYALDDINGPYQVSNFFNNVPIGLHEVYIKDINGCGIVGPVTIPVLGIPAYFTPNGDGFHDYWNVKGVSEEFNYRSTIYIFDRYGKLLKQIGTIGLGWDGTYNGQLMPSDDYWYSIQFEDGRSAKGHFALKR